MIRHSVNKLKERIANVVVSHGLFGMWNGPRNTLHTVMKKGLRTPI